MTAERSFDTKAAPNVEQAVPFFGVTSMEESLRYYAIGLGFEITHKWVVEGKVRWCWLQRGGAALMLQEFVKDHKPKGKLGEGLSICFICKDALSIYREVRTRGIHAQRPFVGNRMWVTKLTDPDGYTIIFESLTDAPEDSEFNEA